MAPTHNGWVPWTKKPTVKTQLVSFWGWVSGNGCQKSVSTRCLGVGIILDFPKTVTIMKRVGGSSENFSKSHLDNVLYSSYYTNLPRINEQYLHELQFIQNAAAKTVVGLYKHDHVGDTLKNLHWLPVKQRIKYKLLLMVFKCLNCLAL